MAMNNLTASPLGGRDGEGAAHGTVPAGLFELAGSSHLSTLSTAWAPFGPRRIWIICWLCGGIAVASQDVKRATLPPAS